jgi:hypothetical protein
MTREENCRLPPPHQERLPQHLFILRKGSDMIRRWSSACFMLLIPLAIRSMLGGDAGSVPRSAAPAKVHNAGKSTAGPAPDTRTSEPLPPLGVEVAITSLQKNARGGIASLRLTVTAGVAVDEAVLSAKAPARVVFADGSDTKTWNVNLSAGGTVSVPVEVIAPEDGRYTIDVEVTGVAHGKTIRRAASHKLLVGAKERKGKVKGGANEYPAAEAKPSGAAEGA